MLQDINKHEEAEKKLASLLLVPSYSDDSGFNFDKFATVPVYWGLLVKHLKEKEIIIFTPGENFIEFGDSEDVILHHYLNEDDDNMTDEVRKDNDIVEELFRLARL